MFRWRARDGPTDYGPKAGTSKPKMLLSGAPITEVLPLLYCVSNQRRSPIQRLGRWGDLRRATDRPGPLVETIAMHRRTSPKVLLFFCTKPPKRRERMEIGSYKCTSGDGRRSWWPTRQEKGSRTRRPPSLRPVGVAVLHLSWEQLICDVPRGVQRDGRGTSTCT